MFLLLGCLCSLHVADAARDPSAGAANSCAGDQTPLTLFDPSAVAGGARCLDGTPAGYYLHLNPSSDDWVVFLEGGGLCVEVIDCLLRKNSSLGSSSFWDRCRAGGNNIASPNAAGNPFAGYNLVYVPYCSVSLVAPCNSCVTKPSVTLFCGPPQGDTWAGNSTAKSKQLPQLAKSYLYLISLCATDNVLGGLYTSGHVILRTLIEDLQRQHGLGSKPHQRLLLSGGSAGGIGVFMNADHVSSWLPSVDVKAAPQAGFYIPEGALLYLEYALGLNISVDNLFSEYVAGLEGFDVAYDSSCVAAMKAAQRPETLCWDATVHYPFVETPLFVAENIFDANQIFDIMIAPSKVLSNGSYPWEVRQFINYVSVLCQQSCQFGDCV